MSKHLTPKDIENPARKSGYDHVGSATGGRNSANRNVQLWRAQTGGGVIANGDWKGPVRRDRHLAAQDYCDYVNGNVIAAPTTYAAPPVDLGVTVHRQRQRKQKGTPFVDSKFDLYDIEMFDPLTGTLLRRKVGITASGDGRYSGVAATFGIGFRPRTRGVTYPNKAEALEAEAILVRTIERDPDWVKVGKECFAPTQTKGD